MKVVCAVLLVVTLILNENVASGKNLVFKDNDAKIILRETINNIGMMIPYSKHPFAKALIKSIEQYCTLNKYKEHNFMSEMLTREVLDLNTRETGEIDAQLVFLHFAMSCSSKLDALLEFIFDYAFFFTDLIDAFRDDEPFKGCLDDLSCYNNYAVRSKWIDTKVYTEFEYNLINKTEEECDYKIQKLIELANEVSEETLGNIGRKDLICLQNEIVSTAIKIFFKYVILIPANRGVEQKTNAKKNFLNDFKGPLNQLLVCSEKASSRIEI